MSDNPFEKELRGRLDNYRSPVDHEELWDQVEAELYPRRKRRALLWWWLGAGAGLILLLGAVVWLSSPSTPSDSTELVELSLPAETSEDVATAYPATELPNYPATNVAPDLGGPALRSETSEDVATDPLLPSTRLPSYPASDPAPDLGGPALRSETSGDVATDPLLPSTDYRLSTPAPAPDLGGPALRSETSEDVATDSLLPTTDYRLSTTDNPATDSAPDLEEFTSPTETSEDVATDSLQPTTDYRLSTTKLPSYPATLLPIPNRLPKPLPQASLVQLQPSTQAYRRWSLGVGILGGQAGSSIEEDTSELVDDFRLEEIGAWGVDLNLGYRFHPRWSIQTGLGYQQLLLRLNGDELISREEETVQMVIERIVYADGQVVERMGTGTRTTSTYRRVRFTQRLNMLNIPLLLRYETPATRSRPLSWYVQGGLLFNLRQQVRGRSLNEDGVAYELAETGEFRSRIGMGSLFGGGISRNFKHNLSLQLGVEARQYFESSTSPGAGYRIRFSPVGLRAGIRWRF